MISKFASFLIIFLIIHSASGQKTVRSKADKAFAARDYITAVDLYKGIENPDQKTTKQLADSYYYLKDMPKAVSTYSSLFAKYEDLSDEVLFRYADAEKATKNYDKANKLLSSRLGRSIDILKDLEESSNDLPFSFNLKEMESGSDFSAFGPAIYKDGIVFSSDRNTERPEYDRTHKPFLDLYMASFSNNNFTNIQLFSEVINTPLHEANAVFTKDGNTIYFTRTNDRYKRMDDAKVAVLQLYQSNLVNGVWGEPKKLSLNSDSFSSAHPALSPDGKTLYFSSDRPGGYGESDLYKVTILGNNSFSEPENLGPEVNSAMKEQFPFISAAGALYFSSNRYTGLGGLDLYRSSFNEGRFSPAYNLGQTVNSNQDDFALILVDEASGFLSSNRTGTDKIYSFSTEDIRNREVRGIVTNSKTGEILHEVALSIYDADLIIEQNVSDVDGSYAFNLQPGKTYRITGKKDGFAVENQEFTISTEDSLHIDKDLQLNPLENALTDRKIDNIYFDYDKAIIRPDAEKILNGLAAFLSENKKVTIAIASHTDAVGSSRYNKTLSRKRAEATKAYLTKRGIDPERIKTEACGKKYLLVDSESSMDIEARQQMNRRSEFKIITEE